VCVCSLRYPACNAQVPYYYLWPTRLQYIFAHYLINGTIFVKKRRLQRKCVFRLSVQFLSGTFNLRRIQRDMTKNVYRSSCKVLIILVRL